jgi:tellurite resistance protein
MEAQSRLQFFPVSFFSTIMGLTGFTIAVQRSEKILGVPAGAGQTLAWFSAGTFLVLAFFYALKLMRFPQDVLKELGHPVKLSFFPTVSISLILISIAFYAINREISFLLFAVGAPCHLCFTLFVLSRWIGQTTFEVHHSNPSWFIPVVGNILVPIVGVEHGLMEISWFFFSIGLVFWLVLLSIIFNRVIFHHPLPEKLIPTFFILIAPPAVGFIAYVKLTGAMDSFARVLYYFALFTVLLLVALYRKFYGIKFYLSWWAYSFPLAAIGIASMLMYSKTGMYFFQYLSWFFLAVLAVVIAVLTVKTLRAVTEKKICSGE